MKRTGLFSLVVVVVAAVGCTVRHVSVGYYDDRPPRRDVYVDHICSHDCHDHYWDGRRIVVLKSGHRHYPGCGHRWTGRYWVVVHDHDDHHDVVISKAPSRRVHEPPAPIGKAVAHVHGPRCGCVWDRRERVWVTVESGHVHGRNCGHVYINGKWCLPR